MSYRLPIRAEQVMEIIRIAQRVEALRRWEEGDTEQRPMDGLWRRLARAMLEIPQIEAPLDEAIERLDKMERRALLVIWQVGCGQVEDLSDEMLEDCMRNPSYEDFYIPTQLVTLQFLSDDLERGLRRLADRVH